MVRLPGGTFWMGRGSDSGFILADELPLHRVRLSAFEVDRHLVTFAQFAAFVRATGYRTDAEKKGYAMYFEEGFLDFSWQMKRGATFRNPFPDSARINGRSEFPVVNVSWRDAEAYCGYAGKRLLTEAEWEYAARAGTEKTRFPWGETLTLEGRHMGNYWQGMLHEKGQDHRINENMDGFLYLAPVGSFPANAWGLEGMLGNVWEMTSDWYGANYYAHAKRSFPRGIPDPQGPTAGERKATRGGSWWCSERTCSGYGLYRRGKIVPDESFPNQGFRCGRDSPTGAAGT